MTTLAYGFIAHISAERACDSVSRTDDLALRVWRCSAAACVLLDHVLTARICFFTALSFVRCAVGGVRVATSRTAVLSNNPAASRAARRWPRPRVSAHIFHASIGVYRSSGGVTSLIFRTRPFSVLVLSRISAAAFTTTLSLTSSIPCYRMLYSAAAYVLSSRGASATSPWQHINHSIHRSCSAA